MVGGAVHGREEEQAVKIDGKQTLRPRRSFVKGVAVGKT